MSVVETGFVTRGLVSVRMDTRRNIRRGNQNQQQEPTTRTTLKEPLSLSTTPMRSPGGDHLVETGFVTRGLVSVRMDTRRNIRRGNQNQQQEPTTRPTLTEPPAKDVPKARRY